MTSYTVWEPQSPFPFLVWGGNRLFLAFTINKKIMFRMQEKVASPFFLLKCDSDLFFQDNVDSTNHMESVGFWCGTFPYVLLNQTQVWCFAMQCYVWPVILEFMWLLFHFRLKIFTPKILHSGSSLLTVVNMEDSCYSRWWRNRQVLELISIITMSVLYQLNLFIL